MITYTKSKNTPISLPSTHIQENNFTDYERDTLFVYTFKRSNENPTVLICKLNDPYPNTKANKVRNYTLYFILKSKKSKKYNSEPCLL